MVKMLHPTAPPLRLSVAMTAETRRRGLSNVKKLAWNEGMLFIFEHPEQHSFTMLDTYIPLDLIFLDPEWAVVGLVENAQPHTSGPYRAALPSQYVVETHGGWIQRNLIQVGDQMLFLED